MGKRELVLVAVFVALGVLVYEFTAPPPPPGSEGFSVGGLIRNMRRGVQGPRETATADSAEAVTVPAAIGLLRVNIARPSDLTITGEDREDVAATLHVSARGFDRAEADASAHVPKLRVETSGDAIVVTVDTASAPSASRTQPPTLSIVLSVPRRLALRADSHIGRFVLSNLASAEILSSRGETRVTGIDGNLKLTHGGGTIEIANAGSLKLTARNSRGTVKTIAGQAAIDSVGGDLTLSDIGGPLEIVDARNTDFLIDAGGHLQPPLRITLTSGSVRVTGLRTEARIDGHNSDVDVRLDAAAPVTIYNVGEILVTPPPDGYALDASATEGRVTVEDGAITPTEGSDSHAEGKVRGGGPSLTLRTSRGRIDVRQPAGK